MAQKFQSIVTLTGQERIAAAIQGGSKTDIVTMVVGDGNGAPTVPAASQTHLVNEVWRVKLNSLKVDAKNKNWLIAEAIAPASVGGFWMRELGLLASDGSLMAVCNMAETYKPSLEQGSGRTQTLRMVLSVTDTSAVTLLIDDSISLATEEYVNDRLAEHEQSRNHPDATLSERGFTILSSTISEDETRAATPKAVKAANDNANGRVPASRKVNGLALTSDINLGAANVGAYTKAETDAQVAVAKAAADSANANANGRVPSSRKVNGLALTADIALGAANVGAYTKAETDAQVAVAKAAADNANANANGRVPSSRKVNGLALTADIDILAADVKALAITTVRAGINPSAGNVGDANELPANATSFVYSNAGNAPTFTGSLLDFSGLGNGYNAQIVAAYAGAGERIGFRTRNGDKKTWNPWYEFYHNGNKPSSSDVGALPANAPELSVNLNTLGHPTTSIGLYFQGSSAAATAANNYPILEAGSLLVARTAYGCQQEYTTFGSGRKFVRGLTGSFNGSGPWGPWKEYLLTTANAASASKLATARTIAGVAFDGQSNIAIPAANVGAYTKAEVDSRLNTKGALNTASKAVNGWWKCGSTGVIIQWGQIPAASGERVVAVTFPVAFPNAVCSMSGIIANPSENVELDAFLEYTNLNNRASVRLMLGNTTGGWSMGGCWMAIGY